MLNDEAKAFGFLRLLRCPALGLPSSEIGTFPQALYDRAHKQGATLIRSKNAWKQVFYFAPQ